MAYLCVTLNSHSKPQLQLKWIPSFFKFEILKYVHICAQMRLWY